MENLKKFEEFNKELKNYLYHFTSIDNYKEILKDGFIYPFYDKILGNGISTTRYKNFKFMSYNKVMLIFDKDKLKQKYKIKPVHWFNQKHFFDNEDDYRKYGPDKKPITNQEISANQYEERIITDKPIPISYIEDVVFLNNEKISVAFQTNHSNRLGPGYEWKTTVIGETLKPHLIIKDFNNEFGDGELLKDDEGWYILTKYKENIPINYKGIKVVKEIK